VKKIPVLAALLAVLALTLALSRAVWQDRDSAPGAAPAPASALRFKTVDRAGNTADESLLAGHSLVILNFWEPWCPPCVGEMPELEKLYEAYKDRGLLILGIYSEKGMEDKVDEVLADAGTSYPILRSCKDFDAFATGYVPTLNCKVRFQFARVSSSWSKFAKESAENKGVRQKLVFQIWRLSLQAWKQVLQMA